MTTPFDTTRLDEECERIADELQLSRPYDEPIYPSEVRSVILNQPHSDDWSDDNWRRLGARVFNICRRPKMVKA